MKSKALFSLSLLLTYVFTAAQAPNLAKVIPPSPNAAAFQKYGEIPVSPYTGIPDISVPVYTVQFRDISIPISLSYHGSGIKVNEESSQVGLGWAMNSGGCISRNIIGDDDFIGWGYFNNYANSLPDITGNRGPTNVLVQGCLYPRFNKSIPNLPTLDTLDLTSYLTASPGYDFQPDQYFYNFLGHSGKFVLKRNRTAALQKAEKIEITCMDTTGSAFRVRDLSGFIYDFAVTENNYSNSQYHNSAWYLTKITSPNGNAVTYKYSTNVNRVTTLGSYAITRDDYTTPIIVANGLISGAAFPTQEGTVPPRDYSSVQLDTIDFTNGIVKFFYSTRTDVSNDKKLDSVSIFTRDATGTLSGTPFKTIALTYTYFDYGATDNDFSTSTAYCSQRLKLLKVTEKGYYGTVPSIASPYEFTYTEGAGYTTNLPSKNSFARDHWGYYNGYTSSTSLLPTFTPISSPDAVQSVLGIQGAQRDPDPVCVQAFALKTIKYPTGGTTELQFESNDFDEKQSQVNDYSYFGKMYSLATQTKTVTYDNVAKQFSGTDTADLRDEYVFTNNTSGGSAYMVHLNAHFRFSNPSTDCSRYFYQNQIKFDIYDSTGTINIASKDLGNYSPCSGGNYNNCLICGGGVFTVNTDIKLPPGKYVIHFYADPVFNGALQDAGWTFTYYSLASAVQTYGTYNKNYVVGGGLRIKRIIDHDSLNVANDRIRRFDYHYMADTNGDGLQEENSYGRRMTKPYYGFFATTAEHVQQAIPTGSIETFSTSDHLMRSSDSNYPLNGSAAGAVVGYDQVTVYEGENGENGKTVYKYINKPDFVSPYNTRYGLPMRPPYGATIPESLNGSLLNQTSWSADGKKVKEVINGYISDIDNDNTIYGVEQRTYQKYLTTIDLNGNSSRTSDYYLPCDKLLVSYWLQKSVFNHLDTATERIYAQGDDTKYEEVITNYYYEDTSHYLPTRVVTTNSKNEKITTFNTYPSSYTTLTAGDAVTQGVLNLRNKHIINAPVEKYIQKINGDGSNTRVTSGVITTYGASTPLPSLAYTTETVSPITNFASLIINGSGATMDTRYKPQIYFDSYDSYGNIIQQHKTNDISSAYVWDYNSSVPVAECVNAAANEIAYTSFEWNGSGNWTIPSATRNTSLAMTGKKSYSLSSGSITKTIANTAKSYIVSFWSQAGTATVNSTSAATSLTRNGWTYNEIVLTAGTASVTVAGTGTIDELRLYPSDGRMSTYTFEPLVGVSSVTDMNNRINYYEYDGLGRLKLVKDMFGNVVKTMGYHYKNNSSN
ncbi:MAG: hypothetical protein QM764_22215 [Chitinophagaceae bacterium]